jgi:hypothetical protein
MPFCWQAKAWAAARAKQKQGSPTPSNVRRARLHAQNCLCFALARLAFVGSTVISLALLRTTALIAQLVRAFG